MVLFQDHRRNCKERFAEIARRIQEEVETTVQEQIEHIRADSEMLQNENTVLECERDPQFRDRVRAEMSRIRSEIEKIQRSTKM